MILLQTLLDNTSLTPRRRTAHYPTFVVKVAQHDEDSSALFTKRVLDRDTNVIKSDVGRSSRGGVRRLDWLGFNSGTTFNKQDGESILFMARLT